MIQLHIVLLILGILLRILLVLAGIILGVLLLVLLVPLRYQIRIFKGEGEFGAEAEVTWLLRLVGVRAAYKQKKPEGSVRIGPFTVKRIPENEEDNY